jgi:DNA-directed RNA polymerase specialized sigma24 family protein
MRISRSALETARYEGKTEGTRQIVLNSFEQGLSLELISSITGLSVEEVESILEGA